ncbi:MAG TPA: energy transducer TonB [Flavobacteriales bacterium]|nr:energy transducer TonB [Flavobacteriales bacterium]
MIFASMDCPSLRTCSLVLLFASAPLLAQNFQRSHSRYKEKFHFALEPGEQIERTWFHYVVTRLPDGHWAVRTFYPETGAMTAHMTFSDKKLETLDGSYRRWYDNGSVREQGAYAEGRRTGAWAHVQLKGARREGRYVNGKAQGIWESKDNDGRLTSSIPYLDGKRHGIGHNYGKDGLSSDTLAYERDSLKNPHKPGAIKPEERMPYLLACDTAADEKGRFRCTESLIFDLLRKQLRYPEDAQELEVSGLADFEFVIDKEGRMVEILAKNALCGSIEEECRRIFALLPAWRPGMQDGKAVSVVFNQPVRFTLR